MYRDLLARNPDDADGYVGLGWALEGLGKREEAEAAMRRAVQTEAAYWGAHKALGAFLFASGRNDEAAAAFRLVTELTPASASGFNNLGATLQNGRQARRRRRSVPALARARAQRERVFEPRHAVLLPWPVRPRGADTGAGSR